MSPKPQVLVIQKQSNFETYTRSVAWSRDYRLSYLKKAIAHQAITIHIWRHWYIKTTFNSFMAEIPII